MGNRIIYWVLISLLLLSCTNTTLTQEDKNKKDLIDAVKKCINSGELPGKLVEVHRSHIDRGDCELYFIRQFGGLIVDEGFLNEIIEWKGKKILLCSNVDTGISEEVVDKLTEEIVDSAWNSTVFFFIQCKTTGKSLLVKPANRRVEIYEIPEIREFTCSEDIYIKENIEIIATSYSFDAFDNYVLGEDTLKYFPIRYEGYFTIYNRSDSCLFFGSPNDSFGYFAIINGHDTLYLDAHPASLDNDRIKSLDHEEDTGKFMRFSVSSEANPKFFRGIANRNYYQKLRKLLQDSIFYFPSRYYGEYISKKCIYPKEKLKVITPKEVVYTFGTPSRLYYCVNDSILYTKVR